MGKKVKSKRFPVDNILAIIVLILCVVMMSACDSSGGGAGGTQAATVSGSAVKQAVSGAEVKIFYFDDSGNLVEIIAENAPVETGPDGAYEFVMPTDAENIAGPLIVKIVGGSMGDPPAAAPTLAAVIVDPAAPKYSGNVMLCYLSAASSVAAGLLEKQAGESGAAPSRSDAEDIKQKVEDRLEADLSKHPDDRYEKVAMINECVDQNLDLMNTPENIPAIDEYLEFLVANLSSTSGKLDQKMDDPDNPGTDIDANFAPFGEGLLASLFPNGPSSWNCLMCAADKMAIENDGIDDAILTCTAKDAMGNHHSHSQAVTFEIIDGRGIISNNYAFLHNGQVTENLSSVWSGNLTTESSMTLNNGNTIHQHLLINVTDLEEDVADAEPPRVVSAGAVGNTEVLVTFSEAVRGGQGGAEDPSSYKISCSLLPDTESVLDALMVKDAELLLPDRTTVKLTTYSMSDVEYTLSVADVKDLSGNPIAPPDILTTPSTVKFTGIPPVESELVDTDGDGLTDDVEQRGWIVTVYKLDGSTIQRAVNSDPTNPDTDGDGISDQYELMYSLNPRLDDTDDDTLSDDQELNRIFSDPIAQDTDKDGINDGLEYNDFGTSPVIADTDGDDLDDYQEIYIRGETYDPRVANLPNITVIYSTPPAVFMVTDVGESNQKNFGSSISESTKVSESMSRTDTTTNQRTTENSQKIGTKLTVGGGWDKDGPSVNGSLEISGKLTFSQGTMNQRSLSWTRQKSKEAQQAVQEFENYVESVTVKTTGGRVTGGIKLENSGDVSVTISSIVCNVKVPDWRNPGTYKVVAAVQPELVDTIKLGPGDVSHEIFVATGDRDLTVSQARELLLNAGSVFLEVSNILLTDENGRSFTYKTEQAVSQTALIVIDYQGRSTDDQAMQPLERYMVATNIVHTDPRTFEGIRLGDALNYLGIPFETNPQGGLKSIRGLESVSLQEGVWFVLSASPSVSDENTKFPDIILKAGEWVEIVYVSDFDKDDLFTREEYLYGTYDTEPDSDEDGIWDYDEIKEGWYVPILGKRVYSNPINGEDYDGDGLNDPQERDLETDPRDADTDGDSIFDNEDPYPNIPNPSPTNFTVSLYEGSDNFVKLNWDLPADYDGVLILRQAGSDIYGRPANGTLYSAGDTLLGAKVVYSGPGETYPDEPDVKYKEADLDYRTTYYYRIYPYDGSSNYGPSAGRSVTTGLGPIPNVIGLNSRVKVENGEEKIRLSWTPPPDERLAGLLILRDTQPIADRPFDGAQYTLGSILQEGAKVVHSESDETGGLSSTFADTNLEVKKTYYYKVFCHDQDYFYSDGAETRATTDDDNSFVIVTMDSFKLVKDNLPTIPIQWWYDWSFLYRDHKGDDTEINGERLYKIRPPVTIKVDKGRAFKIKNSDKFVVIGQVSHYVNLDWVRFGEEKHEWTFNSDSGKWERDGPDQSEYLKFTKSEWSRRKLFSKVLTEVRIYYTVTTSDNTLTVKKAPSHVPPAGDVYLGITDNPIDKMTLAAEIGDVTVSDLIFDLHGSAALTDILNLRIYKEPKYVGIWLNSRPEFNLSSDPNDPFGPADIFIGTAEWDPSAGAYVARNLNLVINKGTLWGINLHITANIAPDAVEGRRLISRLVQVKMSQGSVSDFISLESNTFTITGGTLNVTTPDDLPSDADIFTGSTNDLVDKITWAADKGAVTVSGFTIELIGSADDTDIERIHVYEDQGTSGQYDEGVDELVGTAEWNGQDAFVKSGLNYLISPDTDKNLLITVDVAPEATPGAEIQTSVADVDVIKGEVAAFGSLDSSIFTIDAGTLTVETTPDDFPPAGNIEVGSVNNPVDRMTWSTDAGSVTVSGFVIGLEDRATNADIGSISVYEDNGTPGEYDDGDDILVGTAEWDDLESAYVATDLDYQMNPNTAQNLLVTADVLAEAAQDNVLITEVRSVTASSGDVTVFNPFDSNAFTIVIP